MSVDIGDPRVAQELLRAMDRRVDAALDARLPKVAYGTVASVSGTKASVYVHDAPDASPGFAIIPWLVPAVGDRVRVVMRGADRYIDQIYEADALPTPPTPTPPELFSPISSEVVLNTSTGTDIAESDSGTITGIPTDATAVLLTMRINSTVANSGNVVAAWHRGNEGATIGSAGQVAASVASMPLDVQTVCAVTQRQFRYSIVHATGTITYTYIVRGYWAP